MDLNKNPDILMQIVDAVNGIREYLRVRELNEPGASSWGTTELLPDPIALDTPPTSPVMPERMAAPAPPPPLPTIPGMRLLEEQIGFPITLAQTGGTAVEDDQTKADWTYTVTHALTGKELGLAVDPTAGNHTWVRPTKGYMTKATAGWAYMNNNRELVILWINEVADQGPCTEEE
jgi:hypothetical protein